MAYGPEAIRRRRCTALRKDGKPCRAWALWDDPRQLCMAHAGRHHRGPMPNPPAWHQGERRNVKPCTCPAYAWPHRPGGGLCRWPAPPLYRCTTPPSTHRPGRWRPPRCLTRQGIHTWKQAQKRGVW